MSTIRLIKVSTEELRKRPLVWLLSSTADLAWRIKSQRLEESEDLPIKFTKWGPQLTAPLSLLDGLAWKAKPQGIEPELGQPVKAPTSWLVSTSIPQDSLVWKAKIRGVEVVVDQPVKPSLSWLVATSTPERLEWLHRSAIQTLGVEDQLRVFHWLPTLSTVPAVAPDNLGWLLLKRSQIGQEEQLPKRVGWQPSELTLAPTTVVDSIIWHIKSATTDLVDLSARSVFTWKPWLYPHVQPPSNFTPSLCRTITIPKSSTSRCVSEIC